jgi:hypothetical protein
MAVQVNTVAISLPGRSTEDKQEHGTMAVQERDRIKGKMMMGCRGYKQYRGCNTGDAAQEMQYRGCRPDVCGQITNGECE